MNSTLTDEACTRIEQELLIRISDALCSEEVDHYIDRGDYGHIAFMVCRDTKAAREILDDSPALYEERGASLIITAWHPDRDQSLGGF